MHRHDPSHRATDIGPAGRLTVRERDTTGQGRDIAVQRMTPGPKAHDRHDTDDPTAHPERPLFQSLMTDAGFSKAVTRNLWQLGDAQAARSDQEMREELSKDVRARTSGRPHPNPGPSPT